MPDLGHPEGSEGSWPCKAMANTYRAPWQEAAGGVGHDWRWLSNGQWRDARRA